MLSKVNLQRLLKRLDRQLSGPLVEFSEQFLYGHREILIDYAGLPDDALIKGSLEHGWALDSGRGIRRLRGGRNIYLSWSSDRVARSNIESPRTVPIGAPFAYLVEKIGQQKIDKLSSGAKGVLYFPAHGTEFIQQNVENQIRIFQNQYDSNGATVCLYWGEFINPAIKSAYERVGFKVICAGFSGQMEHTGLGYSARKLAGSPMGGRPNFLLHTLKFLTSYQTLVMGGLGSICFYAAYIGKEFSILDDYYNSEIFYMNVNHRIPMVEMPNELRYRTFVEEKVGLKFSEINFSSPEFRNLAQSELGKPNLLSPSQLHELLLPEITSEANPLSIDVYRENLRNLLVQ
jgi:hypothetical protein